MHCRFGRSFLGVYRVHGDNLEKGYRLAKRQPEGGKLTKMLEASRKTNLVAVG